jgi:hypothetical protein
MRRVIVKKTVGINKRAKTTRRLRNFMLPRIQPATVMYSNECLSLHTQRTGITVIMSFPIQTEDPHASLKCVAVNNGL